MRGQKELSSMEQASPANVRPIKIEEEMRRSYLDYAMSVIVARALPDVRDGLKPVHRRILYAMHELSLRPNSSYKKCARIVGEVLGKYHPHGDSPVYGALVRMAQDFSMRYPLVDGQGNFGSIDDDPPAAMRYTEARLAKISEEMLVDLDRETVAMADNFDASLQEPVVLPARLPNLLVNGASGIAVGMTTNIPPHNAREVCDAICYLIDNGSIDPSGSFFTEATVDQLMKYVKGPDFPTAAIIRGRDGIRTAYETGHGGVVIEGRATIEERQEGRYQIVITEVPFQVNKAALVAKIALLIKDKKLEGGSEVRDESDRDGLRVVVELHRSAQPKYVLNNLYKHTQLRSSFFIYMLALVDGQPQVLGLRDVLQHYIDFRRVVIRRRSEYDLRKAQERAHILDGLRIAIANLDEAIKLIRAAKSAEVAHAQLQKRFDLSEQQAHAILEMQLRRLAALEREKLEQEYQELHQKITELESLLADPHKVIAKVKEETEKLRKSFGDARRTEIQASEAEEYSKESLTPHQDMVVTLSSRGYLKSIPLDTYRLQHRGGRGSRGQQMREGDAIQRSLLADTHDTLLFFTSRGRVYERRCFDLSTDSSKTTRGVPLVNAININLAERVNTMVAVPSLASDGDQYIVLATRRGQVKRMPLKNFANIRSNGLNAMSLKREDELVSARLVHIDDNLVMLSNHGQGIKFPVNQITQRSRQAGGVWGIRPTSPEDQVIHMDVAPEEAKILVLSQNGYGKLTPVSSYPLQSRGGKGVRAFRITDKTGNVAAAQVVNNCEEVLVSSAQAMVIRTSLKDVPTHGRNTQGVMIMRQLGPKNWVVSVACLDDDMEIAKPAPKTSKPRPKMKLAKPAPKASKPEPQKTRSKNPNGQQLEEGSRQLRFLEPEK
jgi:DNA gyrase subunit A